MSLPSNPLPEPSESLPEPAPDKDLSLQPELLQRVPLESAVILPAQPPFPSWSGWDALAVLIFTAVSVTCFFFVAFFVARSMAQFRGIPDKDLALSAWVAVGGEFAAYLVVLLGIFVLVRSRVQDGFAKAIRWNWPQGFVPRFITIGIILAFVVGGVSRFLPIPRSLPIDRLFQDRASAYLIAAFGTTIAPLVEELIFRGILYPVLNRFFLRFAWFRPGSRSVVTAVFLTAAPFAAIHGTQLGYSWAALVTIFFVGIVLTVTRVRANSVAASFLVHVAYNSTIFTLLWFATDHFRHLEKIGS